MVIEEHIPIVRLSVDDREIVELLGHYDSQMLESRMRVFINVIAVGSCNDELIWSG